MYPFIALESFPLYPNGPPLPRLQQPQLLFAYATLVSRVPVLVPSRPNSCTMPLLLYSESWIITDHDEPAELLDITSVVYGQKDSAVRERYKWSRIACLIGPLYHASAGRVSFREPSDGYVNDMATFSDSILI